MCGTENSNVLIFYLLYSMGHFCQICRYILAQQTGRQKNEDTGILKHDETEASYKVSYKEVSYKENGKQEEIQKRWETYALILVKTTKL